MKTLFYPLNNHNHPHKKKIKLHTLVKALIVNIFSWSDLGG